jgi:hypothetical protein
MVGDLMCCFIISEYYLRGKTFSTFHRKSFHIKFIMCCFRDQNTFIQIGVFIGRIVMVLLKR